MTDGVEIEAKNTLVELSPADEHRLFDGNPLSKFAQSYSADPWWPELQKVKAFSMLHYETLFLLKHFARAADGAVIEVGPYLGGSTIALARGVEESGNGPSISIEVGGANLGHSLATADIIADLRANLRVYRVSHIAHILEGYSTDAAIDQQVNHLLNGRAIGLLFLDADGNVARDFNLYRDRLCDNAIIALDDYMTYGAEPAHEKTTTVKLWVDQAVEAGIVEDLGIYRWATWFGRYRAT
jgi:predicted O-methyltransferase YrrM